MSIRYGTKIISGQTEIVNDLTSTSSNKALSANQGRVLKDEIDTVSTDKQDKLVAGDNITIATDGKTISAIVPTKTSDLTNDSDFITSSYHDSTKQNVISDLEQIRLGAEAGSTAIQPNGNISSLTNDANYQTNTQVNSAISTHNSSDTAHSDIRNDISNKQDSLIAGTNISIASDGKTISATDTKYSAGNGLTLTGTTFSANVIDNTTSDSIINALSARVGKVLQEQINNLNTRGKYLSIWNCTTGLAMDEPPVDPYTYETGSFFIVGVVASAGGTNYKPSGSTYSSSTPSTAVETESVKPNDTYYYDGTTWRLLATQGGGTVAFSSILGSPTDNINLANALNGKQDTLVSGTNIKTVNSTSLLGSGNIAVQSTITGGASTITSSNLTANRALVSNASGKVAASDITSTELGYLDGVTSAIQTQLNGKATSSDITSAISTHNSSTSSHSDIRSAVASKSTVSVSDTGTATDEVKYITIDGVEKKLAGGSGRNIGDIFYTTRKDTALSGAVECNGATYSTADYTGAGNIGELLRTGKLPYVSLSEYATLLSTNGVVGVFGWNGTGTTAFRVPTLKDVFIECGQASELGDYVEAGLPNITAKADFSYGTLWPTTFSGAFKSSGNYGTRAQGEGGTSPKDIELDASLSSSIYGNSNTVQPNAIKYRAMIQLFNATTDEAVATVGTVVAQVAANKSNISTLQGYDYVVESQLPTAQNNYTWYRKYKSGWVEQGGKRITTSLITLPVPMANAEYCITFGCNYYTANAGTAVIVYTNQTSTSFEAQGRWNGTGNDNVTGYWQVSGISAE